MITASEIADLAATEYFRTRLPPEFIRGLPAAVQQGYAETTRGTSSHLWKRRAASDRYWSVMEAVAALAESIPGMRVLELVNPNGGGPYYGFEYQGTIMTIHKTEDADAPPRASTSRRRTSAMNEQCLGTLFPLEEFELPVSEIDGAEYVQGLDPTLLRAYDLYIMLTHHPEGFGDAPEFISGIVVDSSNRVLAMVDVEAEAARIAAQDLVEIIQTTEITRPAPQRKSRAKEDQA